jgi:hypothetical protein
VSKPVQPLNLKPRNVIWLPLPRSDVVKSVWDYIQQNKLQEEINKRMINADES